MTQFEQDVLDELAAQRKLIDLIVRREDLENCVLYAIEDAKCSDWLVPMAELLIDYVSGATA